MRLLTTLPNQNDADKLSHTLSSKGIETQIDISTEKDWGSSDYGTHSYNLWIVDEDKLDDAKSILDLFEKNPNSKEFHYSPPPIFELPKQKNKQRQRRSSTGNWTIYLISLCALLYVWSGILSPQFESKESKKTYSPTFTSPISEQLLFDFPKSYQMLDELITNYGIDALAPNATLPPKGAQLLQKLNTTPSWQGIYQQAVTYLTTGAFSFSAPLFEKIQKGEIWRFVSPIFLHADIFHILFNMAWLYILGQQMEARLRPFRYLLFIILAAAFTNTAQYLISGPNFIGFSGVICAMLAFIWQRQKAAPWEGYQIQRSTFNFMMIFIFGLVGLQTIAFLLEVLIGKTISTSIANGAHVAGLLIGWIFSKTPYFTKKST